MGLIFGPETSTCCGHAPPHQKKVFKKLKKKKKKELKAQRGEKDIIKNYQEYLKKNQREVSEMESNR